MKPAVAAAAIGGAALLAVGVWQGARLIGDDARETTPAISQQVPDAAEEKAPSDVVTVEGDAGPVDAGSTPMAQRSAVIGVLNKRNGVSRDLTMKPGQALRVGDTIVRLRACERTAPWEQEQLTGAFLQVDVRGSDDKWRRTFSGWLYKERPALNVVQHPIYDVWPKSCTMSFPDKGRDTDVLGGPSTARKSAPAARQAAGPSDETPSTSDSASPSNAM